MQSDTGQEKKIGLIVPEKLVPVCYISDFMHVHDVNVAENNTKITHIHGFQKHDLIFILVIDLTIKQHQWATVLLKLSCPFPRHEH